MHTALTSGKSMELFSDEFRSVISVTDAADLVLKCVKRILSDRDDVDLTVPYCAGGPLPISYGRVSP